MVLTLHRRANQWSRRYSLPGVGVKDLQLFLQPAGLRGCSKQTSTDAWSVYFYRAARRQVQCLMEEPPAGAEWTIMAGSASRAGMTPM